MQKNIYKWFLLLFCIYNTFIINAQTKSILNKNSAWANLYCGIGSSYIIGYAGTDYNKVGGDTVIEGISYKKLIKYDDRNRQNATLQGLIREENKKFFYKEIFGKEFLLYDFSLEAKQIFTLDYGTDTEVSFFVHKIDSVNIQDTQTKRMFITLPPPYESNIEDIWIEGIGSIKNGLLSPCYNRFWAGSLRKLLCYYIDETLVYQDTTLTNCYYDNNDLDYLNLILLGNTSIYIPKDTNRDIFYPNPAIDVITLYNPKEIMRVEIFNLLGQNVYSKEIQHIENSINISFLSNGFYLIKFIKTDRSISSYKLLKKVTQ